MVKHLLLLLLLLAVKQDGKQPVPPYPYVDAAEIALSEFGADGKPGIVAKGEPPTINDRWAQNNRGVGLIAADEARIIDCYALRNWTGAKLTSSDSRISGCILVGSRDAGLMISRDAGNCYSIGNHCYGARIACYNQGGAWYRGSGDTYADALIGFYTNAESALSNCLFQHNSVADVVIYGGNVKLADCTVMVQAATAESNEFTINALPLLKPMTGKVGVYFGGGMGSMVDGRLEITNWIHPLSTRSGKPAIGAVVAADHCYIRTPITDTDGLSGTTGILVQGERYDLVVDCLASGFDPEAAVIKFAPGASVTGLDVKLRVDGNREPAEFIPTGKWTGSVVVDNVTTGRHAEAKRW